MHPVPKPCQVQDIVQQELLDSSSRTFLFSSFLFSFMPLDPLIAKHRKPQNDIESFILNRWSSRAFDGEPINDKLLLQLFEAARWAPSSYNQQPWRFFYAKRDTEQWPLFFDSLVEFNQEWCKDAAVLILVLSKEEVDGRPHPSHSFDPGLATQNLLLQASQMGLVAHVMTGFDMHKAKKDLHIPTSIHIDAMIAVGNKGSAQDLPQSMQEREVPSSRKPIDDLIAQGPYEE